MTRRWRCPRFRMMDKGDFESFIWSTASADFLAEPEHATIKKAVDAVDEAEQPDHIEVKTYFAKLKNHSKTAASSRSSAGAAGAPPAGQVSRHGKATGTVCHLCSRSGGNTPRTSTSASTWTKITLIPCSLSQTRSTRIPWTKGGNSTRTASVSVLAIERQSRCSS